MGTVCTSGVQREPQMEQKTGEGTDRLTDNPTLPHGAASKLTFCLSPAWLVAVCLRGSHCESTLAWSTHSNPPASPPWYTPPHPLPCSYICSAVEKRLLRWQETAGAGGMIRSEIQIKWERRSYPTECPSQRWESWGPDMALTRGDGAG